MLFTFLKPALVSAVLVGLCFPALSESRAASWETTVTPFVPGAFAEARPLRARYNFGWSGIAAANAEFRFEKIGGNRLQLEAHGGTVGVARRLWSYDINHTALADAGTLRPLSVKETEKFRAKEVSTDLIYSSEGVRSTRDERKDGAVKTKVRRFDFPDALSVYSALLFLRTQPLLDGATHRVVVYPATSSYLCTVTVGGHESITVATGTYEAIKLDVQLSKIGGKLELLPHKKFRNATVWLSNDADRLVLRVEAQVFVGKVFAELQSVQFDNPKP